PLLAQAPFLLRGQWGDVRPGSRAERMLSTPPLSSVDFPVVERQAHHLIIRVSAVRKTIRRCSQRAQDLAEGAVIQHLKSIDPEVEQLPCPLDLPLPPPTPVEADFWPVEELAQLTGHIAAERAASESSGTVLQNGVGRR